MSYVQRIEIDGVDGSNWVLSDSNGAFGAEGAELDQSPKGMFSAKLTSRWINGAFQIGGRWVGYDVPQRDMVLPINLFDIGVGIEDTLSRFRKAWSPTKDTTWKVISEVSGERRLKVRLTSEIDLTPERDPSLDGWVRAVVSCTAGQPMYESDQRVESVTNPSNGTNTLYLPVSNPTDQKMWLGWTFTAPPSGQATVSLPDFSWGQTDLEEYYGRTPGQDADRMVQCPPHTVDIDIDTNPDMEMAVAADQSEYWALFNGVSFQYPVPPWTEETQVPVTINGPSGIIVNCYQRRLWSAEAGLE